MAEVGSGSKLNFPISGTGKLVPVKDTAASAGAKQKYIDLAELQAMVDGKQASLGYTPVTNARTITINGTSYDLTANRSWTVGDELVSNKSDSFTVSSSITYASTKALVDGLATKQASLGYTPENIANKGIANGYTPLNSSAKIDSIYLPDSILGQVNYQGTWNASTNTPTIPTASVSNKGYYYIVSVAGSTNIGGITDWNVGDWIISDGTSWTKVDNTDAISSFNGRTGAITLTSTDVTTALGFTPVAASTSLSGYGITDGWRIGGNTLGAINSIGSLDNFAVNLISNNKTVVQLQSVTTPTLNLVFKNGDGTTPPIITTSASSVGILNIGSSNSPSIYTWDNFSNFYRATLASSNSAANTLFFAQGWTICNASTITRLELASGAYIRGGSSLTTRLGINASNLNIGTVTGGQISSTYGTFEICRVWSEASNSFVPTSGTATLTYMQFLGTINQTGTANGEIKTISFEQTLTAHNGLLTLIKSAHNSGTNRYGLYFSGTIAHYLNGNTSIGTTTNTASLTIGASTTSTASLRIMAGTAPTTPNDGDWWYDGTNVYFRVGSTTKMFTLV